MKKILALLLVATTGLNVATWYYKAKPKEITPPTAVVQHTPIKVPVVPDTPKVLTQDQAKETITVKDCTDVVTYLASDELEGRLPGTKGNDLARDFLKKKMEAAGLKVTLQKFSSSRTSCENVVGVLQGETDSYIVIGGHLDHLGKKGNSIYYGADDNASGATATVEIAEAMAKMKKPKHTIIFICFNAEEQGLIGSSYYVKNALYPIKNTIFMENFDMIGYYKKNGFNIQGGSKIPMVSKAVELLKPKYPNLKVGLTSSAGGGSDHVPFGSAGVPSVFFHTGTHPYYHTPKDTVEKIDFAGMCEIVRFGFDLVCEIDKSN